MRGPILIAKKDLISIREFYPTDKNMIFTHWMRGLYEDNELFSKIKRKIFYSNYQRVIELILDKEDTKVRIACLKDDPDVILGFAIIDKDYQTKADRLHWIYVKELWRNIGIAKDLLAPFNIKTVTHLTSMIEPFKPARMVFNPFM